MNSKQVVTSKTYFKTINILFLALVAGQVAFAIVLLFLNQTKRSVDMITPEIHQTLIWVVPAIAVAGIALGWIVFNARLKSLQMKDNLSEKLRSYQSIMIVRYALMEGPSLLALTIFYITGNYIFVGIAAFIVVMFLFNRPSKTAIIRHLQLHDDEKLLLEDPEAVVYE
jgi:hypothetical protein